MCRRNTGTDNVFMILNRIFREARYLGRIPVVGKFTIGPRHNLGKIKSDFCFEDYLDLSNGITYSSEKGCRRPIAACIEWIREEDLDLESYFFDKIYFLSDDEIVTEKMNRHYDVLIRRDPTFNYAQTHGRYKGVNLSIDFPYSEKVEQLTDDVLDVLGISRRHATAAQRYFLSRENNIQQYGNPHALWDYIPLNKGYYACMHVRASDRGSRSSIFDFASSKSQIKAMLSEAVAKGAKLYIMSDIHRQDFFDFLKPDYRVYRYYDFPQLKRLVSGDDDSADNVMLYLVEKNIMKHATVKILPPHKGPMIYHLNTVYDTSLLKNPPVTEPRPTELQKFVYACIRKLGLTRMLGGRVAGLPSKG